MQESLSAHYRISVCGGSCIFSGNTSPKLTLQLSWHSSSSLTVPLMRQDYRLIAVIDPGSAAEELVEGSLDAGAINTVTDICVIERRRGDSGCEGTALVQVSLSTVHSPTVCDLEKTRPRMLHYHTQLRLAVAERVCNMPFFLHRSDRTYLRASVFMLSGTPHHFLLPFSHFHVIHTRTVTNLSSARMAKAQSHTLPHKGCDWCLNSDKSPDKRFCLQ
ncbi:hypothetical protein EDB87DRAFT_933602 [Lactarius vividus]|nr:hypothetical protein EDB87DRAFT_933602 [Lactarius vividus]